MLVYLQFEPAYIGDGGGGKDVRVLHRETPVAKEQRTFLLVIAFLFMLTGPPCTCWAFGTPFLPFFCATTTSSVGGI